MGIEHEHKIVTVAKKEKFLFYNMFLYYYYYYSETQPYATIIKLNYQ